MNGTSHAVGPCPPLIAPRQLQIPVLMEETAELLPNQCLVRFRGMVGRSPLLAALHVPHGVQHRAI